MSRTYIPQALRDLVAAQARHRCGYCLTAEAIVGTPMELDHLIPESLGGLTEEANLWLACSLCNDHKNDRIAGLDPISGEVVRFFDPRRQVWGEHFCWTQEGDRIVGLL
jgi:5-methylcytosine-specific restriction endonuclease McrA